jgi:hypothetical protein
MKLFSKFVIGFGILVHQKVVERLNEEVDCDRQSSPPDERLAEVVESETSLEYFGHSSAENPSKHESSGRN